MDLALVGILLIFLGVFVIIISSFLNASKVEWAFGGFIGPVPFGFAKNKKMLYILLAIMTIFFILTIFFQKRYI